MGELTASIVIPVYNDPKGLDRTVDSLVSQTVPQEEYEIIVADNNSGRSTKAVIEEYEQQFGNVKAVLEADIQSSYAARNSAIEEATGTVLGFIDADMTVDRTWLEDALEALGPDTDYLAYDVEVYIPEDEEETVVGRYNVHTSFPIREYVERHNFGGAGCIFVRRTVIEAVGPFDWRFVSGGDTEFGHRVSDAGYTVEFSDEIIARHPARTSLRSQIKKEIRVGRGFCQRQRFYPERYGSPGIPPMPSGVKAAGSTEKPQPSVLDRVMFRVLSAVFLGFRGVGYVLEFLTGTSSNQPDGQPIHE